MKPLFLALIVKDLVDLVANSFSIERFQREHGLDRCLQARDLHDLLLRRGLFQLLDCKHLLQGPQRLLPPRAADGQPGYRWCQGWHHCLLHRAFWQAVYRLQARKCCIPVTFLTKPYDRTQALRENFSFRLGIPHACW